MITSSTVSNQLKHRPSDEHFYFEDLKTETLRAQREGSQIPVNSKDVSFVEVNNRPGISVGGVPARFNHYSLGQVSATCRVPTSVLERLSTETALKTLNELWKKENLSKRMALVDNGVLRALTSSEYARLWDADILAELERWVLVEHGMVPAMPTINTDNRGTNINGNDKPALFRGEANSFMFFNAPKDKSRGDDLGGLRKGLYVYNSEVGDLRFEFGPFYFRDMCANFLIWGKDKKSLQNFSGVHRKKAIVKTLKDFTFQLQQLSVEVTDQELLTFEALVNTPFINGNFELDEQNIDDGMARLNKIGFTKSDSLEIMSASLKPEILVDEYLS
jgi:hypothetical protein